MGVPVMGLTGTINVDTTRDEFAGEEGVKRMWSCGSLTTQQFGTVGFEH